MQGFVTEGYGNLVLPKGDRCPEPLKTSNSGALKLERYS